MSDSLRPYGLQHTRLPCPLLSQSLLKLLSIESLMPVGSPNLDLQGSPSFILLLKMCLWGLPFSGKDWPSTAEGTSLSPDEVTDATCCVVWPKDKQMCLGILVSTSWRTTRCFPFSSDVLVWGFLGLSWWPFVPQVFPWELLTYTPLKHHRARKTLLCYKEMISWGDWSLFTVSNLSHYGVSLDFMGQLLTTVVCVCFHIS